MKQTNCIKQLSKLLSVAIDLNLDAYAFGSEPYFQMDRDEFERYYDPESCDGIRKRGLHYDYTRDGVRFLFVAAPDAETEDGTISLAKFVSLGVQD